jgi:hypothetical protein
LPATAVFRPTCSALLVAPGFSRLKLPLAVTGAPLLAMLAFSAACGAAVAWLVTLTVAVGDAAPTRTAPRLIVRRVDQRAGLVDDIAGGLMRR